MRIVCIGGGPAGLYFSILMKQTDPSHAISVIERNRPYDTFGFGVVFSDQTLENLRGADAPSHDAIVESFARWDDIDVHFKGSLITSGGHGFSGIARKKLLNILQARAEELGVELVFEREVRDLAEAGSADLIVASDGINSRIRTLLSDRFGPQLETRKCRFVWLGTSKTFEAFTFLFEETPAGWFTVHAYRYDEAMSTFIVECREETWRAAGLDQADTAATIAFCEKLFGKYLEGHPLISNSRHLRGSDWINFTRVNNEHWYFQNVVLLGDAAHSAHFSVGSGTKLALEDAIGLHDSLRAAASLQAGLAHYEETRRVEVLRIQNAARNSTEWFENVKRYARLPAEQFAYSLLTRSQRISHENLRLRDRAYVERLERWFAHKPVPPMFTPFRLREMGLINRIVVSPMDMYSSVDGVIGDFHLVHLGARAQGGAALVYTEMTCVSPEGRISPGCAGMYAPEHMTAWKRVVDFVHRASPAKICMQLGHSGPKGSTRLGWDGDNEPLPAGNWEVMAPSPVPFGPQNQIPREMSRADMDNVLSDCVRATRMAHDAGFDMLELHCAHGYLFSSFITPLSNRRGDAYGGSLENRLRFPLQVFSAMRALWPENKPMSVRISAHDWVEGGITDTEGVDIARAFKAAGADLIDVSSGQTSRAAKPVYGRMYQTPFSDRIRNEVDVATMAVGNIFDPDHVNGIIAAGRADLCALARPHLADPYWTLHAAAALGYADQVWPKQYLPGRSQYERNLQRNAQTPMDSRAYR